MSALEVRGDFTEPGSDGRVALLGGRCTSCEALMFPRRLRCVECFSSEIEEASLSSDGEVVAFTTVHQSPAGYAGPVPYVLGQVVLNGVTILAHLTGKPPEAWRVGDLVFPCSIALSDADEGRVGYAFSALGCVAGSESKQESQSGDER